MFHLLYVLAFFLHVTSIFSLDACSSFEFVRPSSVCGLSPVVVDVHSASPVFLDVEFKNLQDGISHSSRVLVSNPGKLRLPPPFSEMTSPELWEIHLYLLQSERDTHPIVCDGAKQEFSRVVQFFPLVCVSEPSCFGMAPPEPLPPWPLSPWRSTLTFVYSPGMFSLWTQEEKLPEPRRFHKWLSRVGFQEGGIATDVVVVLDGTDEENTALRADDLLKVRERAVRVVAPSRENHILNPFLVGGLLTTGDYVAVPSLSDLSNRRVADNVISHFRYLPERSFLSTTRGGWTQLFAVRTTILTQPGIQGATLLQSERDLALPDHVLPSLSSLPTYVASHYETGSTKFLRSPRGDRAGTTTESQIEIADATEILKEFHLEMLKSLWKKEQFGTRAQSGIDVVLQDLVHEVDDFSQSPQCAMSVTGVDRELPLSSSPSAWLQPCCLISGVSERSPLFLFAYVTSQPSSAMVIAASALDNLGMCKFAEFPLSPVFTRAELNAVSGGRPETYPAVCTHVRELYAYPFDFPALWAVAGLRPSQSDVISAISATYALGRQLPSSVTIPSAEQAGSQPDPPREADLDMLATFLSLVTRTTSQMCGHLCWVDLSALSLSVLSLLRNDAMRGNTADTVKLLARNSLASLYEGGFLRNDLLRLQKPSQGGPANVMKPYIDYSATAEVLQFLQETYGFSSFTTEHSVSSNWDPWSTPLELSSWALSSSLVDQQVSTTCQSNLAGDRCEETVGPKPWPAMFWGLQGPGQWMRVGSAPRHALEETTKEAAQWQWHVRNEGELNRLLHAGFDADRVWQAASAATGTVWIHFSGDSRARNTMFNLVSMLSQQTLGWSSSKIQLGKFVSRLSRPSESGCWSRVCSGGGAARLNLTVGECVSQTHGAGGSQFLDVELFHKAAEGLISDDLVRYMTIAPFFNEYMCMFILPNPQNGARIRISYDYRKSYSTASAARINYDDLMFRSSYFRPDVLVIGPTHDVAYWADACHLDETCYTAAGFGGVSTMTSAKDEETTNQDGVRVGRPFTDANLVMDNIVTRISAAVDLFFGRLASWHCHVAPNSKIVVLDESVVIQAGPVKHEPTTLTLGALVSNLIAEKSSSPSCQASNPTPPSSPSTTSESDGPWFAIVPTFKMTLAALREGKEGVSEALSGVQGGAGV
eukprot:Rmarinus@m.28865